VKHSTSGTNTGHNFTAVLPPEPSAVFELTENHGQPYLSRVSLHRTEAGAISVAEKIFKTYDEYRSDPDAEDLYVAIVWERGRAGRFGHEDGLFGQYTEGSYFAIREVTVEP
jgi:hypothetical protein